MSPLYATDWRRVLIVPGDTVVYSTGQHGKSTVVGVVEDVVKSGGYLPETMVIVRPREYNDHRGTYGSDKRQTVRVKPRSVTVVERLGVPV